jgi:hypothetical protein
VSFAVYVDREYTGCERRVSGDVASGGYRKTCLSRVVDDTSSSPRMFSAIGVGVGCKCEVEMASADVGQDGSSLMSLLIDELVWYLQTQS